MARHHPKAATTAVNVTSALIAFSNEIGQVYSDFTTGVYQSNPQQGLANLTLRATGVNPQTGQIDTGKLAASITAKVAAYGFNKAGKWFVRKLRM